MRFDSLSIFLKIAERGGLAAAARELGLSPTTVSERLSALESHYGVTLVNRTTRAIRLTEEGLVLLDSARKILDDISELDHKLRLSREDPTGTVRISAPSVVAKSRVKSIVDDFLLENPKTRVELLLSDSYVNIVDEGIDVAIRCGRLVDSTMRARLLTTNQRIICAAPSYLLNHPPPKKPSDLKVHNCLVVRHGSLVDDSWAFQIDGMDETVSVSGDRVSSDSSIIQSWALAGYGIMIKPSWDVEQEIKSGALIQLLADYSIPSVSTYLVFPPNRNQPRRVEVFVDKLLSAF